MTRITRESLVGGLSDRPTYDGGVTLDEVTALGHANAASAWNRSVVVGDGVFSSTAELERFYGPVDAVDLNLKQVARDLARFEGSKSFMYRDSRGYVTTGVGHLLKSEADAQKLPWINAATGKPATRAEVEAAFAAVLDMPVGRKANAYRQEGGLILPPGEAEALAEKRLEKEFLPGLRRLYPQFDTFPASAQHALIDMAYNCGVGGLAKFRNLAAAVAEQDWAAAAAACNRRTSREERNEWTRTMFLKAAGLP